MPESKASDIPPTNVLIVDDNEQNIELLQAYLEEIDGIETSTAKNGIEALSAVAKNKPDLILLDIMMPKMSGYEVCKQIKSDAKTRNIPVIIITALNEASDYERGMESGADDFLTRPLDRADFVTRVRSLLRIKKLRGEFAQGDS
jgi:two-component system cell cycle response regulator